VIGDGEAETGPLAGSWHSDKFLNPATDGAVLPILHLNGYKIANPTVLARIPSDELEWLLRGYGTPRTRSRATTPSWCTSSSPRPWTTVIAEIHAIQHHARVDGDLTRPAWPVIVLRTPKGWTGPKVVDGLPVEGTWRAHQVPSPRPGRTPGTWPCSRSGCAPTTPRSCSTPTARWSPDWPRSPRAATGG
jgi:Phosphoketolase